MFCRYCGTQLEEGARFCTECGNAMDVDIKDSATGTAPISNTNYPTPKKDGFGKFILILAVAGLAGLGLFVVVGLGGLSMIAVPQYNQVTENVRNSTWEANCQLVTSAIAMYQAGHNGVGPTSGSDLDMYISGGFDSLQGEPSGARYYLDEEKFESTYPDYTGNNQTYKYDGSSGGRYVYYMY